MKLIEILTKSNRRIIFLLKGNEVLKNTYVFDTYSDYREPEIYIISNPVIYDKYMDMNRGDILSNIDHGEIDENKYVSEDPTITEMMFKILLKERFNIEI